MKMLDSSEAQEKLERSKVENAKKSLTTAKADAPSVKNAAATIASLSSELANLKTADTKYKNLLGSKEIQMKAAEKDGDDTEAIDLEVVQTKEMLQKVAVNITKVKDNVKKAYAEKKTAEDSEKDVKQKVVDEKEEKSNAKNRWVKDMVLDSIKEKADKKNGVIDSEKKLKTKGELLDKKAVILKAEVKKKAAEGVEKVDE